MWVADLSGGTIYKTIIELDDDGTPVSSFVSYEPGFAQALLGKWMMSLGDEAEAAVNDMQYCVDLRYSSFYAAFDGESLWVTVGSDSEVRKVSWGSYGGCEPEDSFEVPLPAGGFTWITGLAFDGQNVWVGSPIGITKLALDASVVDTFPIGHVQGLAFDGEFMWAVMLRDRTMVKLALDGTEVGSFPLRGEPKALAFDGESIWVAKTGGFALTRMSLKGAELATFLVNVSDLGGLAFDGENIWVSDTNPRSDQHEVIRGPGEDVVVKLAPDGTVLGTFIVGRAPGALAFDGEDIRVALGNGTIVKLSLEGAKLETQEGESTVFGDYFDGESFWSVGDEMVWRVSLDGDLIGTFFADGVGYRNLPGQNSTPIVFDGEHIWLGTREALVSSSPALRNLFPIDSFPVDAGALAFDGNSIWIAGAEENAVSRLTLLKPPPPASEVERSWIQALLDLMNSIESVAPSATSTNSWSDILPFDTTYFYCWDAAGKITHQDESPAPC